jgi:hypothetical protein
VAVLHALRERFAVDLDSDDARLVPIRRSLAVERDTQRRQTALATYTAVKLDEWHTGK